MTSVADIDQARLGDTDPSGYMRYALGPLRPAPKEGKGWLFAAGELAMPAQDLAKWDISIMDQKLLKPASYREMGADASLKNGIGTNYGLGVSVDTQAGHRALSHGGEVSGFTAENVVFPDDRAAIVVLTNQDAAGAAGPIAGGIAPLLFATNDPATPAKLEQAKKIFAGLQHGKIDRSLFTDNANAYFSEQALEGFRDRTGTAGHTTVIYSDEPGTARRHDSASLHRQFPQKILRAWTYEMPDGKLEQYQIAAQN